MQRRVSEKNCMQPGACSENWKRIPDVVNISDGMFFLGEGDDSGAWT